jgi:hypothetical protein
MMDLIPGTNLLLCAEGEADTRTIRCVDYMRGEEVGCHTVELGPGEELVIDNMDSHWVQCKISANAPDKYFVAMILKDADETLRTYVCLLLNSICRIHQTDHFTSG